VVRSIRSSPRTIAKIWRAERILDGPIAPGAPLEESTVGKGEQNALNFSMMASISTAHIELLETEGELHLKEAEFENSQASYDSLGVQLSALRQAHQKLAGHTAETQHKSRESDDNVRSLGLKLRKEYERGALSTRGELSDVRHENAHAKTQCNDMHARPEVMGSKLNAAMLEINGKTRLLNETQSRANSFEEKLVATQGTLEESHTVAKEEENRAIFLQHSLDQTHLGLHIANKTIHQEQLGRIKPEGEVQAARSQTATKLVEDLNLERQNVSTPSTGIEGMTQELSGVEPLLLVQKFSVSKLKDRLGESRGGRSAVQARLGALISAAFVAHSSLLSTGASMDPVRLHSQEVMNRLMDAVSSSSVSVASHSVATTDRNSLKLANSLEFHCKGYTTTCRAATCGHTETTGPLIPRAVLDTHRQLRSPFELLPEAAQAAHASRLTSHRMIPDPHSLFVAALRWGMLHSHVDDVMLALVSPETYWVLKCWRQNTFGDVEHLGKLLESARKNLLDGDIVEGELSRQVLSVSVRTKGLWSTFHKATVRGKAVHDVMALRVVIRGNEELCMRVLYSLRQKWPSVPGRFKYYISAPKKNGYQALHDTMLLLGGQPVEIQVRTEAMHAHAEHGPAAHRRYKTPSHIICKRGRVRGTQGQNVRDQGEHH